MAILAALGILPVERIDCLALLGSVFTGLCDSVLLPWIRQGLLIEGHDNGALWTVWYYFMVEYMTFCKLISYLLILPSLSAFFGMNFTGSSTYTSLSGVERR